jgi:hypothetical protein
MGGIYDVVVEMGFGASLHISSFIKTGSGIQKLIGGIYKHTDTQRNIVTQTAW